MITFSRRRPKAVPETVNKAEVLAGLRLERADLMRPTTTTECSVQEYCRRQLRIAAIDAKVADLERTRA